LVQNHHYQLDPDTIQAAMAGFDGKEYRYPFSLRLLS